MPEIGQIRNSATDKADANSQKAPPQAMIPSATIPPMGGIKIPGSKMAFALITKTKQGKKIKVQKIAIDSES